MNRRSWICFTYPAFLAAALAMSCGSDDTNRSVSKSNSSKGGKPSGGQSSAGQSSAGESAQGGVDGGAGPSATGGDTMGAGGVVVTITPDTSVPAQPWDWTGVIGSGQSLAVGAQGNPVLSTTQPYNNLKLSTGSLPWPVDPANESLAMIPLVEPAGRRATSYPSSWPTNLDGETPHSAMASQVTSMVVAANGGDYVGVHGAFGESGQCLKYLVKNPPVDAVLGRAYAATLVETQAITRLAKAAGKTYGVGAFIMTHGECDANDANSASYEATLYQLLQDYNTEIAAITGQTQKLQLIVSQENSIGANSPVLMAEWQIGVHHPTEAAGSGPKYHLPYAADGIHLTAEGYRMLGEKYGQIYYERVVQGRNWQPLYPTGAEHSGQVITVHFNVPVRPLVWDTTLSTPMPNSAQWKNGKGFEVRTAAARITISSVQIVGDSVQITCSDPLPETGIKIGYANIGTSSPMTQPYAGTTHWGLLRDSDPFVGKVTGKPQPNFAVAFFMDVP